MKATKNLKVIIENILLKNGKGDFRMSIKELRELSYINSNNFVSNFKTLKKIVKRFNGSVIKECNHCNLILSWSDFGTYVDESNRAITKNALDQCLLCNEYL